jgi:hypothetical protein
MLTGDYPGDGKPKPVRFPDPGSVALDLGGTATITLPKLLEPTPRRMATPASSNASRTILETLKLATAPRQ